MAFYAWWFLLRQHETICCKTKLLWLDHSLTITVVVYYLISFEYSLCFSVLDFIDLDQGSNIRSRYSWQFDMRWKVEIAFYLFPPWRYWPECLSNFNQADDIIRTILYFSHICTCKHKCSFSDSRKLLIDFMRKPFILIFHLMSDMRSVHIEACKVNNCSDFLIYAP